MPLFILDRCGWACNMSCPPTPTLPQSQPVLQEVGKGWEQPRGNSSKGLAPTPVGAARPEARATVWGLASWLTSCSP